MVQEADMVEEEGEVKMVRQAQGHPPPHTHTHNTHLSTKAVNSVRSLSFGNVAGASSTSSFPKS